MSEAALLCIEQSIQRQTLEGEVSDGRLDELLAQGYSVFHAIHTVIFERHHAAMMREFVKPEYLIDLPGVDRSLPVIDL